MRHLARPDGLLRRDSNARFLLACSDMRRGDRRFRFRFCFCVSVELRMSILKTLIVPSKMETYLDQTG